MAYAIITLTIVDRGGDPLDVVLGANSQLYAMYFACFAARANPELWAAQEEAARRIGSALAARRCSSPNAEFSLAKLTQLFPTNSLSEIAMTERMDFLRLLPCLKKFRINRPFWAGHAFDAARDTAAHPEFGDFWAHSWGADPADVRLATALTMARVRDIAAGGGPV